MPEQAVPALPPAAQSALLAGNRRLAIALVRQATGLDQQDASDLVALHLTRTPPLAAPVARLDRATLIWAALAGALGLVVYSLLETL